MDESYCVQCTDRVSGRVGDFLHAGDFRALSPVFDHLGTLFLWLRDNGWDTDHTAGPFGVRRVHAGGASWLNDL